ncbi:MAG: hypothetical protein K6E38_04340, partial [Fretibacterium sp.]|nr:hypothetical protein [Fretibacterium sp.]
LGIMDAANGRPWLGGDLAWLKAAASGKGKKGKTVEIIQFQVSRGAGKDAGALFISTDGENWWLIPEITGSARKALYKRWSIKNQPELHAPAGAPGMEERFRASPVGLPEDIHIGADSEDLSIGMGNVNLNPIPRVKND